MRVLHVTDLHLLPTAGATIYGADTYASLQAVLAAAQALPSPPERILATGDLAEDGSAASYRRLRALLQATGLPCHVLPGNHDAIDRMRDELIGGAITMEPVVEAGAWRIVSLDSTVPGQPHGFLGDEQLERLAEVLDRDPARPALVALHHGPIDYCPSTGCHLHDAPALMALLGARPAARAVLAGHGHVDREQRAAHVTCLVTPSTCSQCVHAQPGDDVDHEDFWASHRFDAARRGFRMLTLRGEGEISSQVHWLDATPA